MELMDTMGGMLAMPTGFLPAAVLEEGALGREDTVFGPSLELTVAAMLSNGGVISRTGTYVEVLVVDCSADVIPFLCPFGRRRDHIWFR